MCKYSFSVIDLYNLFLNRIYNKLYILLKINVIEDTI